MSLSIFNFNPLNHTIWRDNINLFWADAGEDAREQHAILLSIIDRKLRGDTFTEEEMSDFNDWSVPSAATEEEGAKKFILDNILEIKQPQAQTGGNQQHRSVKCSRTRRPRKKQKSKKI
jgi:hypothetical protein